MRFSGLTDQGRVRQNNQDTFYCDPKGRFFIVADGMGGHAAGATAALIAVEQIKGFINQRWTEFAAPKLLNEAIQAANDAILVDQKNNPENADMGTTVVMTLMDDEGRCWSAHVGDSRLYRLRGKEIMQMTEDHTLIARAIRLGEITPAQARIHAYRHILERCLGRPELGPPAIQPIPLQVGDRLVLCTDGLTDELEDPQILQHSREAIVLEEVPSKLIEAALEHGGRDNVTVVVAEYLG